MAEWQVVLREASKTVTPELALPHRGQCVGGGRLGWSRGIQSCVTMKEAAGPMMPQWFWLKSQGVWPGRGLLRRLP